MRAKDRFIEVFRLSGFSYRDRDRDLELRTGIDRYRWQNLINKEGQKLTEEHFDAIERVWPEYIVGLPSARHARSAGRSAPRSRRPEEI
jgi:hypothetical protein